MQDKQTYRKVTRRGELLSHNDSQLFFHHSSSHGSLFVHSVLAGSSQFSHPLLLFHPAGKLLKEGREVHDANDEPPEILSPSLKEALASYTSNVLVHHFHSTTVAVLPVVPPVTVSPRV